MATIQAIPTRYAGCHFRSRLEARWAVFFDALGIPWEYEPQGFNLEWRLELGREDTFSYLPDFYLPGFDCYAEVKGSADESTMWQLLNATAALGKPLLLLGPSRGVELTSPVELRFHKGDIYASTWPTGSESIVASDAGRGYSEAIWPQGWCPLLTVPYRGTASGMTCALNAARSARFEHGQSGAT
jgi:hypothetical protein